MATDPGGGAALTYALLPHPRPPPGVLGSKGEAASLRASRQQRPGASLPRRASAARRASSAVNVGPGGRSRLARSYKLSSVIGMLTKLMLRLLMGRPSRLLLFSECAGRMSTDAPATTPKPPVTVGDVPRVHRPWTDPASFPPPRKKRGRRLESLSCVNRDETPLGPSQEPERPSPEASSPFSKTPDPPRPLALDAPVKGVVAERGGGDAGCRRTPYPPSCPPTGHLWGGLGARGVDVAELAVPVSRLGAPLPLGQAVDAEVVRV